MAFYEYDRYDGRKHENEFYILLRNLLKSKFADSEKNAFLFRNIEREGFEIDNLLICDNAIIIIETKNFGGHISGGANIPWLSDGIYIMKKGSRHVNPFRQVKTQKYGLKGELYKSPFFNTVNKDQINALIVFQKKVTHFDDGLIPDSAHSWLGYCDYENFLDKITAFKSPSSLIRFDDPQNIVKALGEDANWWIEENKRRPTEEKTQTELITAYINTLNTVVDVSINPAQKQIEESKKGNEVSLPSVTPEKGQIQTPKKETLLKQKEPPRNDPNNTGTKIHQKHSESLNTKKIYASKPTIVTNLDDEESKNREKNWENYFVYLIVVIVFFFSCYSLGLTAFLENGLLTISVSGNQYINEIVSRYYLLFNSIRILNLFYSITSLCAVSSIIVFPIFNNLLGYKSPPHSIGNSRPITYILLGAISIHVTQSIHFNSEIFTVFTDIAVIASFYNVPRLIFLLSKSLNLGSEKDHYTFTQPSESRLNEIDEPAYPWQYSFTFKAILFIGVSFFVYWLYKGNLHVAVKELFNYTNYDNSSWTQIVCAGLYTFYLISILSASICAWVHLCIQNVLIEDRALKLFDNMPTSFLLIYVGLFIVNIIVALLFISCNSNDAQFLDGLIWFGLIILVSIVAVPYFFVGLIYSFISLFRPEKFEDVVSRYKRELHRIKR